MAKEKEILKWDTKRVSKANKVPFSIIIRVVGGGTEKSCDSETFNPWKNTCRKKWGFCLRKKRVRETKTKAPPLLAIQTGSRPKADQGRQNTRGLSRENEGWMIRVIVWYNFSTYLQLCLGQKHCGAKGLPRISTRC